MKATSKYKKNAIRLVILLLLLTTGSLLWIISFPPKEASAHRVANIYQNGKLIQSISLDEVSEAYTFTVTGTDNCTNEIEVRPGSIGIISADCPDKLCVHMGFITSSRLPVTCLPNHLVIQITEEASAGEGFEPDIVTY